MRHSYATAALKAGVPARVVSERLGHATVAFTLDVYGHVLPGMDADAAAVVANLVLGGPLGGSNSQGNENGSPTVIGDPSVDKTVDKRANGPEPERR